MADDGQGGATVHQTELPRIEPSFNVYARRAVLLPNGQLLMDVGWISQNHHFAGWFIWSPHSGWKSIHDPPGGRHDSLYDVEGNEVIYSSGIDLPGASVVFRSERINTLLASTAAH